MANGRCRLHGGASPGAGPGHPAWKHGARSRLYDLPRHRAIARSFARLLTHPQLRKLDEDLALISLRVEDLLQRLGGNESEAGWEAAVSIMEKFDAATKTDDSDKVVGAVNDLRRLLRRGMGEEIQWRELREVIAERADLVSKDAAIQQRVGALVPASDVIDFVGQLVSDLESEGVDHVVLGRLRRRWATRLGGGADRSAAEPATPGLEAAAEEHAE